MISNTDIMCLYGQPPIKTLDIQTQANVQYTVLCMCCHNSLPEQLNVSYTSLLVEDSQKLMCGFLQTLPYVRFPSDDFAVYPYTERICNSDYNDK